MRRLGREQFSVSSLQWADTRAWYQGEFLSIQLKFIKVVFYSTI